MKDVRHYFVISLYPFQEKSRYQPSDLWAQKFDYEGGLDVLRRLLIVPEETSSCEGFHCCHLTSQLPPIMPSETSCCVDGRCTGTGCCKDGSCTVTGQKVNCCSGGRCSGSGCCKDGKCTITGLAVTL